VSYGFLSRDAMEKCHSELKKSEESGSPTSLPKILIEKGYISAEKLIQFMELRQGK
jgi:hypothetical protein